MHYRKLGTTGLTVSVIGIGTWQLGGEWGKDFTEAEVAAIFDAARETGINLIDTAECYGDHVSERLIGAAIARDREKWIVATKFGHIYHSHMNRTDDYSKTRMLEHLEGSLRALRTDYIDLLQVHSGPDPVYRDEALWDALRTEKQRGRIRHIGASINQSFSTFQLSRAELEVAQIMYNYVDRRAEAEALPLCRERNLGVFARVPLASGLLSGKYKPGYEFPQGDVRRGWDSNERFQKEMVAVEAARKEVPAGVPMAQWALAWVLHNPAVTAVIPGVKSPEQIIANAKAANLEISQPTHPQRQS